MWVEFLCFIAEELFWHVTELMHPSAAGDVHEKLRSEVLKALWPFLQSVCELFRRKASIESRSPIVLEFDPSRVNET